MSQWAIDGVGRSRDIFKSMKNAVSRGVQINLLYNNHNDADRSHGYSPYELKKKAKRKGQVCFYSIFIQGIDVADGVLGGLIHDHLTTPNSMVDIFEEISLLYGRKLGKNPNCRKSLQIYHSSSFHHNFHIIAYCKGFQILQNLPNSKLLPEKTNTTAIH